jgi:hypothetical protein
VRELAHELQTELAGSGGHDGVSGIELAEKIKKGQFKTGKLGGGNATRTELWNAELEAWAQFATTQPGGA